MRLFLTATDKEEDVELAALLASANEGDEVIVASWSLHRRASEALQVGGVPRISVTVNAAAVAEERERLRLPMVQQVQEVLGRLTGAERGRRPVNERVRLLIEQYGKNGGDKDGV